MSVNFELNRPLFVIGAVRSGLSAIFERISAHEQVAWVSDLACGQPERDDLVRRNLIYHAPLVGAALFDAKVGPDRSGAWLREHAPGVIRRLPFPTEPWRFWGQHLSQFRIEKEGEADSRPPTAADIDSAEIERIRAAVLRQMRLQRRPRFISYYGVHPRIGYMSRAFPDAQFVHVVRDGRAVCESHLRMMRERPAWGSVRKTWPEEWPDAWREPFEAESRSLMAFAAMRWMGSLDCCWAEAHTLPSGRFLEVAFEDFVQSPGRVLREIQRFAELPGSSRVERFLRRVPPVDNNRKWRSELDADQLASFDRVVTEKRHRDLLRDS